MRRLLLFTILLYSGSGLLALLYGQEMCGADGLLAERIQSLGLTYEQYMEQEMKNIPHAEYRSQNNKIYRILVVVHILHFGGDIGAASSFNISQARIDRQISVLNAAYAETHLDVGNIPTESQAVRAGDTNIRFYLADEDPDGQPTSGVTRTAISKNGQRLISKNLPGIRPAWDQKKYMNIWIVPKARFVGIGVASIRFPPFTSEITNNDGIAIATEVLAGGSYPHHGRGDVLVHEVGHYFGLFHVNEGGCPGPIDDGCEDTPKQARPTESDEACDVRNGCNNTRGMPENYMDLAADVCKLMFTACQRDLMHRVLVEDPYRKLLWKYADQTPRIRDQNQSDSLKWHDDEIHALEMRNAQQSDSLSTHDNKIKALEAKIQKLKGSNTIVYHVPHRKLLGNYAAPTPSIKDQNQSDSLKRHDDEIRTLEMRNDQQSDSLSTHDNKIKALTTEVQKLKGNSTIVYHVPHRRLVGNYAAPTPSIREQNQSDSLKRHDDEIHALEMRNDQQSDSLSTHDNKIKALTTEIQKLSNAIVYHVPQAENKGPVRLYPNPSTQYLQFAGLSSTQSYTCKIYAPTGILLLSGTLRSTDTIDISSLSQGLYTLILHTEEGKETLHSTLIVK